MSNSLEEKELIIVKGTIEAITKARKTEEA